MINISSKLNLQKSIINGMSLPVLRYCLIIKK